MNLIQSINGSSNGMFGRSLAINKYQNVLAVGEPGYNSNIGAVKIYNWNGSSWNIMGNTIIGNLSGDSAGYSVALNDSGTIVAFGEIGYDPPSYSNNGRIRIFYWNSSISDWSKYGNDLLGILGVNNNFGSSVSISNDGNTLACGAPNYNSNRGYVYIYNYNNGNWNLIGNMAGIGANSLTGSSVQLSNNGNTIAISSPQYNNGYYNNLGYTQIYTYNGGSTWNQIGTNLSNTYSLFIKAKNTFCRVTSTSVYAYPQGTIECWVKLETVATVSDYDICLLGNAGTENRTMWCSCSNLGEGNGRYIKQNGYLLLIDLSSSKRFATKFKINDGLWHHIALVFTSDATNNQTIYVDGVLTPGTNSTTSIDITNVNNVFTNSFSTTTTNFTSSYNFSIGGCSTQPVVCQAPIKTFNARIWNVPQTQANIALYMNQIITSAPGLRGVYHINQTTGSTVINQANIADVNTRATITGANYEFVYDNPTGIIGINGNNSYSGSSISLANNGNTIAIGEPGPVNGRFGNVRVFNRNYSNWVLVGNTINTTIGNNFGSSVSLTEDGTYLSVGAYSSNIAGNSGYVRLYNYSNNNWNQVGSTINGSANQTMGYSTALSNNLLVVGAPSINTNGNGSVSIYKLITNASITVNSSFSQSIGNNTIFNINASSTNNETPIQYTSINPLIANVDSYGNITIYSIGNTRIQLFQPNTSNYNAITANTIIYVNKNLPTLSIQNFNVTYLTPSFSILPNIITNNTDTPAPTYTYSVINSTYPNVANIVAGVLTIGNAGTANISISQSETANYLSVTANTTVTVSPLQSTLNYTIPSNIKYKDLSFNLLANSNNQSATILYSALNPLIANVTSTGNVIVGNAGTANINLTINGTNNYIGISSNVLITVDKLDANLGYPNSSYTKNYKDQSFNLNANTTNPESSQILYTTDNNSVATVNATGDITIGNAGTANITLTGNATTNYNSVNANILITVNKIQANLGYPFPSYTKNYKDLSFNVNANTTNTDNTTILYTTDNPIVANVNTTGNVTIGNVGTANITLTKSETANYNSVTANIVITVNKSTPTLTIPNITKVYRDPSFSIIPNISTNNTEAPVYSYSSDNQLIANIVDGIVTIGNAGTANIVLTQSETTNYVSVTANTTVTVNKSTAELTFPASFTKTYNDASFSIISNISTNNSEGPTYSYNSDLPLIANIVDGIVTIGNAGTTNIVLTQSETTNYASVTANTTITVNKLTSNLTFPASFTRTFLDPSFSIISNISTNNPEGPTYSYNSDLPLIANIVNGIVIIGNAGTANIRLTQSETTNYASVTANTTITVNKSTSTLSISNYTRTYSDPSFSIIPNISTNNPEGPTYSYSSNFPLIANIVDGIVTVGNAGIANIVLTQSETTNYTEVTANTTITVNKSSSTLSISNYTKTYNDASFSILPNITTNNTDGPTYSYSSNFPLIANIVNGTVTVGNAGIANIMISQSETTNYTEVTANTTITVNKSSSTLSISNYTKTYNDASFSIISNITTNNTDGPTYSYNSDLPLIANIVDGIVTIGNAGITNIVLTQSETTNYASVTANTTITVNKSTAELTFPTSFTRTFLDPSFSIIPNITTNNPEGPTYSYNSDLPLIANIVDGIVTIGNAGTTNIVLTQSETTNYASVTANTSITVNKLTSNLTFPASFTRTHNDGSFSILPNISTNNPEGPTYTYISAAPLIANIVDGIVTIGNAGTTNIVLTQSETTNYMDISATTSITVNKITAELTFPATFTKIFNDPSFSILPNISTNNTEGPTYSYISDSPLVANIVEGIVTIGNAGIANIILTQSETTNYTSITANTTITVINQLTANLTIPSSFTRTYNDASFSILPNISTNNTEGPTYSYISDSPLVANIVDGIVTIGNAGIANIVVSQSETLRYTSINANTTIIVNKSTASFTFPTSFTRTYNDASFSILPNIITNNTDGPTYSYTSNNPLIANIVDGTVIIGNTGIANIVLTQSETTNYMDISATTSITVNKSTANLSFPATFTRTYNDASFSILPNIITNNTDGPTYSYTSDSPLIANIVDGIVTIGNAGTTNITIIQSATTNYTDISATTTVTVNKLTADLTVPASFAKKYRDASFSILPNISTTNTDPYSTRIITYQSDNSSVANVVAGIVTIGNIGNARIELYQPETTNYFAVTANTNIQVSRALSVINILPFYNINYKNKTPFHLNATTNNTETSIIYTSLDTNIATVDASGVVTIGDIIGNVGNTSIQLYQSETANYLEVTATTFINVGIVIFEKQFSLEWNGKLFVLTIRNDTQLTSNYLYSYDGLNWSSATDLSNSAFLINKNPYNIKWTGTDYAMIGDLTTVGGNTILKSKTGIHYSPLTTNTISPMFDLEANLEFPHTITFPRNITLALGGLSADSVKIAYSIDEGITWLPTTNSSAVFNTTANNAVWNGKLWVAVGSANNTIATSTNGIDWVGRGSYIFTTEGFGIAWSNEQAQFIGAGSGANALAYSYDGVYWMGLGSSMLSVAYDVQWNGSIWVATGVAVANNKSIAYSYDGRTWLNPTQTNLFDIAGKKLSWNGEFWMVVGSSTSSNSYYNIGISNDGIVWNMIFNHSFIDTTITNLYSSELITIIPTLTNLLYASKYNEL